MTAEHYSMDGPAAATLLERGLGIIQTFADHTISAVDLKPSRVHLQIAPYAFRPEIMRFLLLSAMDGRQILSGLNDPMFLIHNLRLSNHTSFPDGVYGSVGEPSLATPEELFNTDANPFPVASANTVRVIGSTVSRLTINATNLSVHFPHPRRDQEVINAKMSGRFSTPDDRQAFEASLEQTIHIKEHFDDVPDKHGVAASHYSGVSIAGGHPLEFTMYDRPAANQ